MENMVKHILEIDKQVQELTVDTDAYKTKMEKEISSEIDKINKEYDEKFESDVERLTKQESDKTKGRLESKSLETDRALAAMKKRAEENHTEWAKAIFSMATEN